MVEVGQAGCPTRLTKVNCKAKTPKRFKALRHQTKETLKVLPTQMLLSDPTKEAQQTKCIQRHQQLDKNSTRWVWMDMGTNPQSKVPNITSPIKRSEETRKKVKQKRAQSNN